MQNRVNHQNAARTGMSSAVPPADLYSSIAVVSGPADVTSEGWEGPTLSELADRVEHQFGEPPGLAGIYTLGFARDEPLSPCDIHLVCDLLGLPAEDFGVDL